MVVLLASWAPGSCHDPAFAEPPSRHVMYETFGRLLHNRLGASLVAPQRASVHLSISKMQTGVELDISSAPRPLVQLQIQKRGSGILLELLRSSTERTAAEVLPVAPFKLKDEKPADVSEVQARLTAEAAAIGLSSVRFLRVPADYYDQSLEWRRDVLGGEHTSQAIRSRSCTTSLGIPYLEEAPLSGVMSHYITIHKTHPFVHLMFASLGSSASQ